ncbi:MAG TPA: thiamine phosphate synthase [Thermoanaerobaculia bacterium]|jgi:thiamine-phosphate pyrophosphorylase|nr:thiamine phosphate synthase [Thermoanaerobaculia bacterium]
MKSLYVTDRAAIGDEALAGVLDRLAGAPALSVTLREAPAADGALLARACEALHRLAGAVPLYVHRRFDVALAAGAAGVHLPSNGLPLSGVRANTPRGFRIGVSTHSAPEAEEAISQGADLVVIGPVFDTPSKRAFGPPLGPGALAALPRRDTHSCDVYAIGGVDESRLSELEPYRDRISGIAAIRLFQASADPRAAAERIAAR